MANDNTILIYQDENEITKISVRFADEDLWLTQNQLAEIYDTTQQNISQHIEGIYQEETALWMKWVIGLKICWAKSAEMKTRKFARDY